jgi:hypothetical protein
MMEGVLACILLWFCGLFGLMFYLQRRLYRQRRRKRLEPGFYPSTRDLGNALHTLQIMAQPRITYVMQMKQEEPKEDEEGGDDKDQHEELHPGG